MGKALRMMVPRRDRQAEILVQAVQNHNPQVLIVDEIGTKEVRQPQVLVAPVACAPLGPCLNGYALLLC